MQRGPDEAGTHQGRTDLGRGVGCGDPSRRKAAAAASSRNEVMAYEGGVGFGRVLPV